MPNIFKFQNVIPDTRPKDRFFFHNTKSSVGHQIYKIRSSSISPSIELSTFNIQNLNSTLVDTCSHQTPILTHLRYTFSLARLIALFIMKFTTISIGALLASLAYGFTVPTTANNNRRESSSLFPKPRRNSISEMSVASSPAINLKGDNDVPALTLTPPRKICLMVEPTPFTHVSGYSNRFNEMLRYMAKAGDKFDILTVDSKTPEADLPKEKFGYKIQHTQGFTFPLYDHISLTFDLPEMKGASILEKMKPDLIHASSP